VEHSWSVLNFLAALLCDKLVSRMLPIREESNIIYVRHFYEALYQVLLKNHWSSKTYRVVLTGNAGTGKSWFQAYALRKTDMRKTKSDKHQSDVDQSDLQKPNFHKLFPIPTDSLCGK
jgi:hypothetical protein